MRFLRYILCALLFVTTSFAETININWKDGDTTYAQTTCEIGGDVILPTPPTKRGYTFKGWAMGYTRLEYIESTGTQYIDTGIFYSATNSYQIGGYYQSTAVVSGSAQNAFFGWDWGGMLRVYDKDRFTLTGAVAGTQYYIPLSPTSDKVSVNFYMESAKEGAHTICSVRNSQGVTASATRTHTTRSANSLPIFGVWDEKDILIKSCMRCFSSNIFVNGVLARNFVPVRHNGDNAIGMYDTVSGQFFTNQGTGEFIAGPVAENQSFDE